MQQHRYDRANFSAASRPWDKCGGGGGIQTLRYVGGQSPKHFFRPFGPQFGLKMRGGRASPLNPPLNLTKKRLKRWLCSHLVSRHSTRVRCSRRVQGDICVNTPVLCIQSRSEFRCGASTRSRPCTTTTARFSVGTDVNSTACMLTSLVWKYVSVYWQSILFFFAQNGAIASIMNNIRCKVLESASAILWLLCRFCGNCVRTLHQV